MNLRKSLAFCALFVSLLFAGAQAQTPSAPPAAAPKDELVQSWLETVQVAGQFANSECQKLDSVRQYNNLRQLKQQQIEARLPGYTVDWSRFQVVAKPAAAAPAAK